MADIKQVKQEYDGLLEQLSDPELISDWEKFEKLSKRKGNLEKIITKEEELKEVKNKIEENKGIVKAQEDKELISLAEAETVQLQERGKVLEKELEELLKCGDSEPQAVIVEIRAGTGGEEAALFAGDLYQMYSKYAQLQGWRQKVLESHPTELGGFKEIIFELKNGNVFAKMQFEGGVHRVQRIPRTEKAGRVHTSTASVAVLPKPKATEIKINPKDLKVDVYKSSGPGGQYVNKRMTAVRITHLPTGIVVTSQTERNLQQNKENAMSILGARVLEKNKSEQVEKMGEKRKAQIKRAERADKIRTYNFPQDRVTDHRIQKSFHNIEGIMAGKLDPIIEALTKID
ncbi:MAG: peptide chain release factor 1 [Candidatus Nealsonbacteria bacterium CG09_land_8_20_14_0_10_42_14]|uniref:Peptide chain release factor 1 n=1 Tax=Candidatus Nealsonbacteria bacterium CG09_land_8_20_14_0_10_42_14 TaxID=1974707 RepID=A0A2H0WXC9_9BACT|nr:MAG: peptide chain release factor 1 [Candidatus Nealsonbacteria bacterium CG09_land_8_20_14_0_10_42_14]